MAKTAAAGAPGAVASGKLVSLAIGMMLLATLLFAFVDTSTKWLLGAGLTAMQLAFMRYSVQLAVTVVDVGRRGFRGFGAARDQMGLLVLRAALLVGATLVNFVALNFLSLTVASSIMFTAPIIVSVLAGPLLGEQVGPWRWGAIALGFLGVLVVVRPFGEAFQWAALMMLIPATGVAFYSILTRRLAGDVDPGIMQFVLGAVGTLVLAPLAIWTWVAPSSLLEVVLMVGLGVFAWLGHELLIRAHIHAEANMLMPFSYIILVYLAIAGWLVFGDVPDRWTILGTALIVMSGLIIWRRDTMRQQ